MTKTVITLSITVSQGGICFLITSFWLDALIKRTKCLCSNLIMHQSRGEHTIELASKSAWSLWALIQPTISLHLQSCTAMPLVPSCVISVVKGKDSELCLGFIYCLFLSFPRFIPLILYTSLASVAKCTIALSGFLYYASSFCLIRHCILDDHISICIDDSEQLCQLCVVVSLKK